MLQPKIIGVKPLPGYKLQLKYETKEQKIFNVFPYISGDWFGKLKDEKYFNTVRISGNTVEWKDGQDIAPHELYEYSSLEE
ncbi:MAG: DUF2442 domain-containing protein [Oscillospiraceae bacterium]|nr:DUF2442 domain-containing protein [Oscillospiraceae bacterium]